MNFSFQNCYGKIGDFTVVSTRNSNITMWERYPERVEGKSCTNLFLFIPFSFRDMKDAIEDAIDKANKRTKKRNEALLDANIYSSWWTIFIFTRMCYEAIGIPANSWGERNYYD
ncbi:MAG: hypothetical protein N3A69_12665 [Leptospiraceae bacterium]|nr:hypothetical protein [Leptospiraceae bacterium]